jgi:hypothetical protein
MGITVFLLICVPAVALMYVPLTTRQFRPAPVDVTPRGVDLTPAPRKALHTLCWRNEAEDHSRGWINAA